MSDWKEIERKVAEVSLALGVRLAFLVVASIGAAISLHLAFNKPRPPETPEARIERLADALRDASRTIGEIEGEMRQRQQLVDRLRQDAETAQALAVANRAQVDAIAQVLRAQIQQEKDADFWADIAKNTGFALLGVLLAEGSRWWRLRRRRGKRRDG